MTNKINTIEPLSKQDAIWPRWYKPPTDHTRGFIRRASFILGVPISEIRKPIKKRHYAYRRFALAHVMRDTLGYSYAQIAQIIGLQDHSSVVYAVKQSKILVDFSDDHAAMVDTLEMIA